MIIIQYYNIFSNTFKGVILTGMLRFYTAIIFSRLIYALIKLTKKSGGTSFAGMVALKICPDFLKYCRKYAFQVATITGTNGKTTTSGILAHILENDNNRVIHNVKGANMLTGIANAFSLKLPCKRFDYAVLESDEAYLTKLYDFMSADFLIVTNLFRDQLDRYGELATTAGFIQNAIDKINPVLFLNADDPLVANLGKGKESFYYGFENVEICSDKHKTSSHAPSEVFNCICGEKLKYSKQFFAQQGHYYCPKCGYKRPDLTFSASAKIYDNYSQIQINYDDKTYDFKVNLIGLYNAYNALGAISFALFSGIPYEIIYKSVENYKSIFGRTEKRIINGHETLIQLIKNPTGASEVLKTVDTNSNIIIAINDNYADGRDVSWLWDADFEQLKNTQKTITVSGIRAKDMAVRLKYAGISTDKIKVEENIKTAIETVSQTAQSDEKITILPTYTALLKLNKMKFK